MFMFITPKTTGDAIYQFITALAVTAIIFGLGSICFDWLLANRTATLRPFLGTIFSMISLFWAATLSLSIVYSVVSFRNIHIVHRRHH